MREWPLDDEIERSRRATGAAPATIFNGGIAMRISDRLRELREARHLSQGDIERRTGLLRCYVSRLENGHTVPSLDTLEKIAAALEVEFHELFPPSGQPPAELAALPKGLPALPREPLSRGEKKLLRLFQQLAAPVQRNALALLDMLPRISPTDQDAILHLARHLSRKEKETEQAA